MILAYHAIWTTYGTWLPNDPRGSYSEKIYNAELANLGRIQYGRQDPQPDRNELRRFWTAAIPNLKHPPFFLNNQTRGHVASAFRDVVRRFALHVYACAIMNDHIHIIIARESHRIEYLVGQLKAAGTRALNHQKTPWARDCWKVFLNSESAIATAAQYVEQNPIRAGLTPQCWDFVTPIELE